MAFLILVQPKIKTNTGTGFKNNALKFRFQSGLDVNMSNFSINSTLNSAQAKYSHENFLKEYTMSSRSVIIIAYFYHSVVAALLLHVVPHHTTPTC